MSHAAYLSPQPAVMHTTTEVRAPTDASIRILREMELAAEDKVIKAVRVESTAVDAVLHKMHDLLNFQDCYRCVFKLNGAHLQANFRTGPDTSREGVAVGIRDAIAKEIANVIAADVLKAANRF